MADWKKEFNVAITVCDKEGKILEMNDKSAEVFKDDGGFGLFECHSNQSAAIIRKLLNEGSTNVYTIEKRGIKKIIYQSPWRTNGEIKGLVEFSIEIPFEMPHYKRD